MAMINIIWLPPNGPLIQQNVGYFWGWCAQALDYTGLQTSVAAPDPSKGLCARSQVDEHCRGRFWPWPCAAAVAKTQINLFSYDKVASWRLAPDQVSDIGR